MILRLLSTVLVLLLLLACSCAAKKLRTELIGRWESTNLDVIQHKATDDATWTLVFRSDGTYISYATRVDGTRHQEETGPFDLDGSKLVIGRDYDHIYRVEFKGGNLILTVASSLARDDTGLALTFHRK